MGGSQPAPKTYSPQEQAQAQIQIDEANAARQAAAAEQERQRAAAEKQANIERTTGQVNQLYNQGQAFGQQRDQNLGFADTYGLLDTYNQSLNNARSQVPSVADNPASYFDFDNLWNKATNQVQSAQQSKLDNTFRDKTKVGWQNNYFADTADDSILDSILGDQYGSAFDTIDAARARGQISQGAFDNTVRGLDQKKLGARSTLEDLGLGVLGGYRTDLGGIADQYSDQITNYKLGQNLNLDDFTAALGNRKNELSGRMQGDIYRAVGDTNLFNTDALLAKGSAAAGVSNSPLRNAFRDPNLTDPTRTTGTTGVF